jgi:hypothetical protein
VQDLVHVDCRSFRSPPPACRTVVRSKGLDEGRSPTAELPARTPSADDIREDHQDLTAECWSTVNGVDGERWFAKFPLGQISIVRTQGDLSTNLISFF